MIVLSKQTKRSIGIKKEQVFCSVNMQTDMMLVTDARFTNMFFLYLFVCFLPFKWLNYQISLIIKLKKLRYSLSLCVNINMSKCPLHFTKLILLKKFRFLQIYKHDAYSNKSTYLGCFNFILEKIFP